MIKQGVGWEDKVWVSVSGCVWMRLRLEIWKGLVEEIQRWRTVRTWVKVISERILAMVTK